MVKKDGRVRKLKSKKAASGMGRVDKAEGGDYLGQAERNFEIYAIIILLCFGIYHSVLYFGHQVVPNPDFTGFVHAGRKILSFQLPTSYKRAPVLGMLQVMLSFFVGGQHPELTAGRLLNAILHPLNIVLLYLVGKKVIGRSAVWVAIIAIINPWLLQVMTEPIADTTLLFFVLITFYFILRRSKWSYLFASIASMVRFEGAVLIFAAFVVDMVNGRDKKERLFSFIYTAVASIPISLWMLGTFIHWQSLGSTHYLKELGGSRGFGESVLVYIKRLWQAGFYPLFLPKPGSSKSVINAIFFISKILVAVSFVFGLVCGLFKRRWEILAFFVFLLPCFFIHLLQPVVVSRYSIIIIWILMLVCVYGFKAGWELIESKMRIPRVIVIVFTVFLMAVAVFWLLGLCPYLSRASMVSRQSSSMPYVGILVVCLIYAFARFFYRMQYCWRDLVIAAFVVLMIISNQFLLAPLMGDGKRDVEFKYLADWYVKNAQPGDKLISTMANILRIFAPEHKDCFIHITSIKADDPVDFVEKCYEEDITYVTWDSRVGVFTKDRYYRYWGIKNIAMLAQPENAGPYEFVKKIRGAGKSYINVFRLSKGVKGEVPGRDRRNF